MKFLIFIFLFAFLSCKNEVGSTKYKHQNHTEKGENKSAITEINMVEIQKLTPYEQVMAIHDVAMAKMKNIEELRQTIRFKIDTIDLMSKGAEQRPELRTALGELNRAHDVMMDWMDRFHKNYNEKMQKDSLYFFLNNEIKNVLNVNNIMNSSILFAEKTSKIQLK